MSVCHVWIITYLSDVYQNKKSCLFVYPCLLSSVYICLVLPSFFLNSWQSMSSLSKASLPLCFGPYAIKVGYQAHSSLLLMNSPQKCCMNILNVAYIIKHKLVENQRFVIYWRNPLFCPCLICQFLCLKIHKLKLKQSISLLLTAKIQRLKQQTKLFPYWTTVLYFGLCRCLVCILIKT